MRSSLAVFSRHPLPLLTSLSGLFATFVFASSATAQALPFPPPFPPPVEETPEVEEPPTPQTLRGVLPPRPQNLDDFIADEDAAVALGKLFFWDMQVGSDGIVACASCHFANGVDNRSNNQLHPGRPSDADGEFGFGGPNFQLSEDDFPFHKLSDPADAHSWLERDRDEVVSSQGVVRQAFVATAEDGSIADVGQRLDDPVFNVQNINTRRVAGRNTPSMINAAFNDRTLWDGRAQNAFNGVNPFGDRAPSATLLQLVPGDPGSWGSSSPSDVVEEVRVRITDSSLASQATGAPLNGTLMSWAGRTWPDIGKKLLFSDAPLAYQRVDPNDSVLGSLSNFPNAGVWQTYSSLVEQAFRPEWWDANVIVTQNNDGSLAFRTEENPEYVQLEGNEFTQKMFNFSLFFGLAVQAYETTLISDSSPFDDYVEGDYAALTSQQRDGLELFFGEAKCANCHGGPGFTNAFFDNVQSEQLERMVMGDGQEAVYDNGFYNIGVRPSEEDVGVGGNDPFGNPLSNSALTPLGLFPEANLDVGAHERLAVQGAFKVPGLRNVELTPPYFHNGGQLTLRQVVEFYNRGGDFPNANDKDADIEPLDLSDYQMDALVAFLKSLTDTRVSNQQAPFDHPELYIVNGHQGDKNWVLESEPGIAADRFYVVPETGAEGGEPLLPFLGY